MQRAARRTDLLVRIYFYRGARYGKRTRQLDRDDGRERRSLISRRYYYLILLFRTKREKRVENYEVTCIKYS